MASSPAIARVAICTRRFGREADTRLQIRVSVDLQTRPALPDMTTYQTTTALHYAAYRPPLHNIILEKIFPLPGKRQNGLDIGCGTGLSCQALVRYCNQVIGIDPSMAMLRKAETQQAISYLNAHGEQIPLTGNSVDVVTMAGSLNYLDRKLLIAELGRICRSDAVIAIYDFDIDLSHYESHFTGQSSTASGDYNHQLNLSGFTEVEEMDVVSDEVMLNPAAGEIAHLLLADDRWHGYLEEKFQPRNVFESLQREIEAMDSLFGVKARIYYALYQLVK
jgi:ubiquinone/menaquinone biosynthesis C-methylase UbiE